MKKILSMLLSAIMVLSLLAISTAACSDCEPDDNVRVVLNGVELEFDVPPTIINGRTMVPMRVIFEALGFEVEWFEWDWDYGLDSRILAFTQRMFFILFEEYGDDFALPEAPIVIASYELYDIIIQIDTPYMTVFDWFNPHSDLFENVIKLDVPPQVVNGRTLVPLRAIAEATGATVEWNEETKIVTIETVGVTGGIINDSAEFTIDHELVGVWFYAGSEVNGEFCHNDPFPVVHLIFRPDGSGYTTIGWEFHNFSWTTANEILTFESNERTSYMNYYILEERLIVDINDGWNTLSVYKRVH